MDGPNKHRTHPGDQCLCPELNHKSTVSYFKLRFFLLVVRSVTFLGYMKNVLILTQNMIFFSTLVFLP